LKPSQRFDYGRLAEALQERVMVDPTILRELLHQAQQGIGSFTEALVFSGHVADWDLSRMVCELYQLPFLPTEVLPPDEKALAGLDKEFLHQHALVPLGRFGQLLTVSMPGLVPANILGLLAAETDAVVLPVVGSVQTNRSWVDEHLAPAAPELGAESGWGELFDDADAAVLMDLKKVQDGSESPDDLGLDAVAEAEAALEFESSSDEDEDLEVSVPLELDADDDGDLPGLPPGTESLELPPQPEFGA
jgi:hypothetical protein